MLPYGDKPQRGLLWSRQNGRQSHRGFGLLIPKAPARQAARNDLAVRLEEHVLTADELDLAPCMDDARIGDVACGCCGDSGWPPDESLDFMLLPAPLRVSLLDVARVR